MSSDKAQLRSTIITALMKNIDLYRRSADNIGRDPQMRMLMQEKNDLVRERTYTQMALDGAIDAFEQVMINVEPRDIPLDPYRLLQSLRGDKPLSTKEASDKLNAALESRRQATESKLRDIPEFIELAMADPQERGLSSAMTQNWATLINGFHMATQTESALHAQEAAEGLSSRFNRAMTLHNLRTAHAREIEQKLTAAAEQQPRRPAGGAPAAPARPAATGPALDERTAELLKTFGDDVTARAKAGKVTAAVGREADVNRTIATLVRSADRFALNTGPDGIGKSAVTEAVAQAITSGNAPAELKDARIIRLQLREMKAKSGSIHAQSPQGARGYDEFIDNLHTILKNVSDYNLKNGPQIVLNIDELGEMNDRAPGMFLAKDVVVSAMAEHKGLRIIGETSDVQFKALESGSPSLIGAFSVNKLKVLSRDANVEALQKNGFASVPADLLAKTIEWSNQFISDGEQPGRALDVLISAQAHAKLSNVSVDESHIVQILSDRTGRPKHMFGKSTSEQMKILETELPNRVVGQKEIPNIVRMIKAGNSAMQDPNKPIASILSVGPTGNGKTETAKAIADLLGIPLITIDMSNFQDQHAKAKLLGAPPGYVGFDKKAALEDVADSPYCVLLLDEIDKAHPEAHNIFLSVLDEGRQQLMNGKTVRFNNCIIIMTSNFGARAAAEAKDKVSIGFGGEKGGQNAAIKEYKEAINSKMPPEYQNRIDYIAFYDPLVAEVMEKITVQKIAKVSKSLREAENIDLQLSPQAVKELAELGYDPANGARPLDRKIKEVVKVPLIEWMDNNPRKPGELLTLFVKSVKGVFDVEVRKPAVAPAAATPKPA